MANASDERTTVMLVFGTRPEAIKLAPLVKALQRASWCRTVVTVTAQHREMLDQVLDLFAIVPDHDLAILRPGQTLSEITSRALDGLGPVFDQESPDVVVVQGDTTSTLVGALAAFYRHIPVVHIEAGLRTDDPFTPFPEEMNRRLTSRLASLHLAATARAADNLRREGVSEAAIAVTGNTVIDALHEVVDQELRVDDEFGSLLASFAANAPMILVTAHRRESWGDGMEQIGLALSDLAAANPSAQIVFPIHRNPIVRESIARHTSSLANIHVIEPLGYHAFAVAMKRARLILTDSGGVQEEAPALGVPVLVMRDATEREEAIEAGTAMLVGTDRSLIVKQAQRLLDDDAAHAEMANAKNPFGDGHASERIVAAIAALVGRSAEESGPL